MTLVSIFLTSQEESRNRTQTRRADSARRWPTRCWLCPWQSGGAGLSSTAPDYLRFAQMLLNRGALDGTRLLSPFSVDLMRADHLPPGVLFDPATLPLFGGEAPMPVMGQGFGLGVAVRTQPGINPLPGSVGNYYWERRARHVLLDRSAGGPYRHHADSSAGREAAYALPHSATCLPGARLSVYRSHR